KKEKEKYAINMRAGIGFHSRRGLGLNTGVSANPVTSWHLEMKNGEVNDVSETDAYYISMSGLVETEADLYSTRSHQSATSGSQSISFTENSHSPVNSMPMNNYRMAVNIGAGASEAGVFGKAKYGGFFDTQSLQSKGKAVPRSAYGYEKMADNLTTTLISGEHTHFDFSRSKDGNVKKTTPNLANPQLTHDTYTIQGQGIGGSFRPYRNEVGRIFDPVINEKVNGGSFNLDFGAKKVGWGGGYSGGGSYQGPWDNSKNTESDKAFTSTDPFWMGTESGYRHEEKVVYKSHGEKTSFPQTEMDFIAQEKPVGGTISGNGFFGNFGVELDESIDNKRDISERIARNNLIHKLTNEEINSFHADGAALTPADLNATDVHYLSEFEIFYYNWSETLDLSDDPTAYLDRKDRGTEDKNIEWHNGGYKVLDQSGSYFVYGLPAYNNKEVEEVFTIDGLANSTFGDPSSDKIMDAEKAIVPLPATEGDYKISNTHKYHYRKETPPYAYSYLLTSILGADYVDLGQDGPSDDDLGYWVKFDYVKYADDYKWRAPYQGCMYHKGKNSTLEDDRASYQYGEKEMWYLSRIETETHIAIFELSEREDQHEAKAEYNQMSSTDSDIQGPRSGLKVDRISLYEKEVYETDASTAVPIQTVHFEYDYSLCKNVDNNSTVSPGETEGGKLTLKKVWFTYEGKENGRGAMNPYEFYYDNPNPDYSTDNYDRWGMHKEEMDASDLVSSRKINHEMPYSDQYYQGFLSNTAIDGSGTEKEETTINKNSFQEDKDEIASSWNISLIKLPSGGTITVDYEADDYAYVQNERATQMTYITKINDNTSQDNFLYKTNKVLGGPENDFSNAEERRIYFKLENPIPTATYNAASAAEEIYNDYVKDIVQDEKGKRNLYFRVLSKLKGEETVGQAYVSGYLPLEDNLIDDAVYNYGVDESSIATIDGEDAYTEGFVTVECAKKKNGDCQNKYHPIALAAWQYLRANCPEILSDMGEFGNDEVFTNANKTSAKQKAKKVKSLLGWLPEFSQMFTGYRNHCYRKELAQQIILGYSMIRLTTPDKKKYGGGLRVK
ncbi:MAG: hypothetical protein MI810_08610, partial [Flavobacteriales bacterium]|nr:hypothetical protein [Flavobacteriales bacterium]